MTNINNNKINIYFPAQKSILGNDKTVMTNSPNWCQERPKRCSSDQEEGEEALFEAGGEAALMNRRDLRQKRETTSFVPVSKCFNKQNAD